MKKRVLIVCGVLVVLIIIFVLIVIFNKGTWFFTKEYSLENMKRYVSKSTQMVICLYEENREEVCDNELVRITNSDTLNEFATIIRRGNLLVFTEPADANNTENNNTDNNYVYQFYMLNDQDEVLLIIDYNYDYLRLKKDTSSNMLVLASEDDYDFINRLLVYKKSLKAFLLF